MLRGRRFVEWRTALLKTAPAADEPRGVTRARLRTVVVGAGLLAALLLPAAGAGARPHDGAGHRDHRHGPAHHDAAGHHRKAPARRRKAAKRSARRPAAAVEERATAAPQGRRTAVPVQERATATPDRRLATFWSDEFTGPAGAAPDPGRWDAEVGGGGWGNHELQTYTASTANAALDGDGHLAITARPETVTGPDGITRAFTSARLISKQHVTFRYGQITARVRVPAGRGLLAQIWALGDDVWSAGWPESGEIDLMEVLGERPSTVIGSLHGPLDGGAPFAAWARSTETTGPASLAAGFHTYTATWTPQRVAMALDGRPYATFTRADVPAGGRWVFDKPFFLVLNLAVGGDWPGAPDASTPWPATMLVDWIRLTPVPL